ncbi:MAG: MATE family efflux transporter [Lachnospiraceae bacterium]|nr:MATE family efflux transporter [Lachnospiraceae bacterium]
MFRKFLKYIFQSISGMIGVSVYILADTFFVAAKCGANGLAVLNLILPVYGLIFAIGSMIGIGSATRYSISTAKGTPSDYYFTQSVFWCALLSIPFVLTGIFIPKQLLAFLGADAGLVKLGYNYMRVILLFSPFFMANYTFTAFARNDHATSIAMIGSISGSFFNTLFDYIFMYPLHLGFTGAGLATGLSPVATMLVCSTHFLGKNNHLPFRWRKPSLKRIIRCCQLGVSSFFSEISSAVITIIFNFLILNIAGNIGLAAYGIVANISLVAMAMLNGLAQGIQPLISQSYGIGDCILVRRLRNWSISASLVIEFLIISVIYGMTDTLICIFNSEGNTELLKYAHTGLRLYFLAFLVAGINIVLVAYFSAIGRARPAFFGSLMRGIVAIGLCALLFAKFWGLNGVWLSFFGSEIITLIVLFLFRKS